MTKQSEDAGSSKEKTNPSPSKEEPGKNVKKEQPLLDLEKLDEENLKIYPERRGGTYERSMVSRLFNRELSSRIRCERNIKKLVDKHPLVKLMLSALKSHGCEVDLGRHVTCEACNDKVTGGYDPYLNQIVICHNRTTKNSVQGVLSHEFIHMFDYCRAKFDFNNIEHVACSEIRAANLIHCSYMTAVFQGTASPFRIAKTHRLCVKAKAVASLLLTRKNLSREDAWSVIDKVFDRCYNDLEPVGRIIRRASDHMEWVYRERFHYNYDIF